MAKGKKTGGRDFEPGNPGRPPGIVEAVPRSAKAALLGLFQRIGSDTAVMGQVLREGLAAKAPLNFQYFKLLAEQSVGLPDQNVNVQTQVIHKHYKSSNA